MSDLIAKVLDAVTSDTYLLLLTAASIGLTFGVILGGGR